MIVSLKESFKTSFTVKETPSIVTLPFGIIYFKYSFGNETKKSVEFPFDFELLLYKTKLKIYLIVYFLSIVLHLKATFV
jgi:hypothetical protein